jgi:PAS domain S-box-containing protein
MSASWGSEEWLRRCGGESGDFTPDVELTRFHEHSTDLLCVAGSDGSFKLVNPAWESRLGWTTRELVTGSLLDFVHPDDRDLTLAELRKLARHSASIRFENRCRDRSGRYHRLAWHARRGDEEEAIYATARDVTREKALEREIVAISDREKEVLGRELHDGVCQTLAGIRAMSASLSKRLLATGDSEAACAASEICALLKESLGEVRQLSHALAPGVQDGAEIGPSVEAVASSFAHMFGIDCTVDCPASIAGNRQDVTVHLVRIVQEAVSNAVRHGGARRIAIAIRRSGPNGLMTILDDGDGLPASEDRTDGIGLQSMAYRARLIGGYLVVTNRRRRGAAVICVFPRSECADAAEGLQDAKR